MSSYGQFDKLLNEVRLLNQRLDSIQSAFEESEIIALERQHMAERMSAREVAEAELIRATVRGAPHARAKRLNRRYVDRLGPGLLPGFEQLAWRWMGRLNDSLGGLIAGVLRRAFIAAERWPVVKRVLIWVAGIRRRLLKLPGQVDQQLVGADYLRELNGALVGGRSTRLVGICLVDASSIGPQLTEDLMTLLDEIRVEEEPVVITRIDDFARFKERDIVFEYLPNARRVAEIMGRNVHFGKMARRRLQGCIEAYQPSRVVTVFDEGGILRIATSSVGAQTGPRVVPEAHERSHRPCHK